MYKLFSQRKREAIGDIPDVYEYDTFSVEFRNQFFHIVSSVFEKCNKKANAGYGERFLVAFLVVPLVGQTLTLSLYSNGKLLTDLLLNAFSLLGDNGTGLG